MSQADRTDIDVPVYEESYTSAAIDGARIAAGTAQILVSIDNTLPEEKRLEVLAALLRASACLDEARFYMGMENATSLHVVSQGGGRIIIPRQGQ